MNARHRIDVALRTTSRRRPPVRALRIYAQVALARLHRPVALSIALVGDAEMAALNERFRGVARSTNVLAFVAEPASHDGAEGPDLLGDVVVCVPVVAAEAVRYEISREARFAHMLVHGILHLLGHDHDETAPRRRMERSERRLLAGLGFGDPYASAGRGVPVRRVRDSRREGRPEGRTGAAGRGPARSPTAGQSARKRAEVAGRGPARSPTAGQSARERAEVAGRGPARSPTAGQSARKRAEVAGRTAARVPSVDPAGAKAR